MVFMNFISKSIQVYKRNGIKSFLRLPLDIYDINVKPNVPFTPPGYMQIEPTVVCNLRCTMCDTTTWNRKPYFMKFDEFKKVIDTSGQLKLIQLQGMGESLLNKDIYGMIKYAKKKNITVHLTTNGTLLTERNIVRLIDAEIDRVDVSLDSPIKENYENIRINANFENVVANVKLAANSKLKKFRIAMTLQQCNINDLRAMIEFLAPIGVKYLLVQIVQDWGKEEWSDKLKDQLIEESIQEKKILEMKKYAESKRIELLHDFGKPKPCDWPWNGAYVTADGFVTPCCIRGFDPRKLNFGSAFEDGFDKVWKSDKYQNFRKAFKNKQLRFCEACRYYNYE
jgi:radical SAM protein with 4Fe4S-binding SPASM domain